MSLPECSLNSLLLLYYIIATFKLIMVVFGILDYNECVESNAGCEQQCTNTITSFFCSCKAGYILDPNGFNCTGEYFKKFQCAKQVTIYCLYSQMWMSVLVIHAILMPLVRTLTAASCALVTTILMAMALTALGNVSMDSSFPHLNPRNVVRSTLFITCL